MLKIELSKVYFSSSVANYQREAEPRRVIEKVLRSEQLLPAAAVV